METYHLYVDGKSFILIFDEARGLAECWAGKWSKDNQGMYEIVNPSYVGVVERKFSNIKEVKEILVSSSPISFIPYYLSISSKSPLDTPSVMADIELGFRLMRSPNRGFNGKIKIVDGLSVEERGELENIKFLLNALYTYHYRIDAGSKLNFYADAMHFSRPEVLPLAMDKFLLLHEWKQMGARDAAINMFHFLKTFEALREKSMRNIPTLRKLVDHAHLRIAWKLYSSQFRDTVQMRHVVAHTAEFYNTHESRALHSGNMKMFIEYTMIDSVLSLSSYGKFVSIDTAQDTIDKLGKIKSMIVQAFKNLFTEQEVKRDQNM